MIKSMIVEIFAEEMEKVLDEKSTIYQDSWKELQLYELKEKLNKQFEKLITHGDMVILGSLKHNKKTKRTLTHIANYCLFIFTKLNQ